MKNTIITLVLLFSINFIGNSQPVMTTGGQQMPDEWIDRDTGHKVIKLTRRTGQNASFYFHNNPFIGNKMVFCGEDTAEKVSNPGFGNRNFRMKNWQMYWVDLNTLQIEQLTNEKFPVRTEIVCPKTREIFYQWRDSVFSLNAETKERKLIYVKKPDEPMFSINTVNADGTLLAGTISSSEERELFKNNPKKSDYFDLIYEAKLPRSLFTINTKTGEFSKIYTEVAWLNHLQFSPTNPALLMFCHEGPWHKVDRIWTIDVVKKDPPILRHKRTMDMEIAGHEWFGNLGNDIYCDLQQPRGEKFYVDKIDIATNQETKYELTRDEWSVHYTTSWGEKLMAGDGGARKSVANAKDGKWIYLFEPQGNKLKSTRLVNMINHDYELEPNVHFSPDNKWIIFRANFEGAENIYAVEI